MREMEWFIGQLVEYGTNFFMISSLKFEANMDFVIEHWIGYEAKWLMSGLAMYEEKELAGR